MFWIFFPKKPLCICQGLGLADSETALIQSSHQTGCISFSLNRNAPPCSELVWWHGCIFSENLQGFPNSTLYIIRCRYVALATSLLMVRCGHTPTLAGASTSLGRFVRLRCTFSSEQGAKWWGLGVAISKNLCGMEVENNFKTLNVMILMNFEVQSPDTVRCLILVLTPRIHGFTDEFDALDGSYGQDGNRKYR